MRDPKNLTIATLCVTATMLATILVLMHASAPAYGVPAVRGGDYIWVNGAVSNAVDLIYIIDVAQQKLNVYGPDPNQNQIVLKDQLNLKLEFKP